MHAYSRRILENYNFIVVFPSLRKDYADERWELGGRREGVCMVNSLTVDISIVPLLNIHKNRATHYAWSNTCYKYIWEYCAGISSI